MKDMSASEGQYSLRGRVYTYLREAILDGRYKDGESLTEMKIAEELNVSRTPVREAVRQLELEGLVESIPNKGSIVKGISMKDMEDIYSIRIVLEELAGGWAVENISDEELQELQEVYDLMEFYTPRGDIEQLAKLNTRFHEIIYSATKSNILNQTLKDFQFYIKWVKREVISKPGRKEEALEEHYRILLGIKARDKDAVKEALHVHLSNSSKRLLEQRYKEN